MTKLKQSKAQKDVLRSKLSNTSPETDLLAKKQSKNILLSLCLEKGRCLGFNSPVSLQEDVKKIYKKIQNSV